MYCSSCGKSIPDGSAFCLHCGKAIAASQVPAKKGSSLQGAWKVFAVIAVVVVAIYVLAKISSHSVPSSSGVSSNPIATILHLPVVQKVFSGQLVVKPGQFRFWTIAISPQMTDAHLIGSFHASGG
jgi:predicted nucleic acid-binding Zn ribbon protein